MDYSALLFVPAESPEQLKASLAALAGPKILDLPQRETCKDEIKIAVVHKRLAEHPGWALILDNVDDDPSYTILVVDCGELWEFPVKTVSNKKVLPGTLLRIVAITVKK